jgi:hypothetical protein
MMSSRHVLENEQIYSNIDVLLSIAYQANDTFVSDEMYTHSESRIHFVSAEDRFRLGRSGTAVTKSGSVLSLDRVRAFDGTTTRVFEQKKVGNISPGRIEDGTYLGPHTFALGKDHVGVPLSVFLKGDVAIADQRNNTLSKEIRVECSYVCEDLVDYLKCHKILANLSSKESGYLHFSTFIWLAEDRNYLPVKTQSFLHRVSSDIAKAETHVSNLREVSPGCWYPFTTEEIVFNNFAISERKQQQLQWKQSTVVKSCSLSPKYADDYFSTIDYPDGTRMYEVVDGKILRAWGSGSP